MKRTPLIFAALIPFAVAAGGKNDVGTASVDKETLRGATAVSNIVGKEVRMRDGNTLGEIETVAFNRDGSVAYYEVEPDMDAYNTSAVDGNVNPADNAATSMGGDFSSDDMAGADREAVLAAGDDREADVIEQTDEDRANVGSDIGYDRPFAAGGARGDTVHIAPDQVRLDGEFVSLDSDLQSAARDVGMNGGQQQEVLEAGDVIGMQVDLSDAESFGEVEEILLSEKGDKAVALVVDSWDGMNKERRALPVEFSSVDHEAETIRYENISKDQLATEDADLDLEEYRNRM